MTVVFCSVAVVLSFQSVSDIVYSSMTILCITHVDEMFYEAFRIVFQFRADFEVADDIATQRSFPLWYHIFKEFLCIFPMLLGIQIFSRAVYTGIIPTKTARDTIHWMMH